MTPQEIVNALPGLVAEIEKQKGGQLTPELVGDLLAGIGEAIKSGQYAAARVSPQYGACTCPTIVSNNPHTGRIDPMLCLCPSC